MSHADFVHLRVHSAYSLSEGALKIKQIVELCRRHAMPALAITDSGNLFGGLEFALAARREIALVGDPAAADTRALADAIFQPFLPNKVVLLGAPGEQPPAIPSPLLEGRHQIDGKATAYVCENYACKLPCTNPAILSEQLAS